MSAVLPAGFRLRLLGGDREASFDGVQAFAGKDASGRFGILAHHVRFMTVLVHGLARLRLADGAVRYVALPGGVMRFADNVLTLGARHWLMGDDPQQLVTALSEQVAEDARRMAHTLQHLRRLEADLLQRLAREGGTAGAA
jgi:F-type H+-transporting ATPase subunit epsilon